MRIFNSWICLVYCVTISLPAIAAVEIGGGSGASCFNLVSVLERNWMEVKRHLVAAVGEFQRAESEDFVCVSNYAVTNAMETRVAASSSIRCFRGVASRGLGFCCDQQLSSCAQLNPRLFPELYQSRENEREYEAPKSNWVKLPSSNDQWQSN